MQLISYIYNISVDCMIVCIRKEVDMNSQHLTFIYALRQAQWWLLMPCPNFLDMPFIATNPSYVRSYVKFKWLCNDQIENNDILGIF